MFTSTYVQIYKRDSGIIRVVELPGVSIRVGQGALCEVRLPDPDLAEVQCLLRCRDNIWHIQPIGPAGLISIEGDGIDHIRPLFPDVPLRVGSFYLLIKQEKGERSPNSIDVGATDGVQYSESATRKTNGPMGGVVGADRLRSWQGRVELRERWIQARQEKRRWEARWRAASEGLRAHVPTPPLHKPPQTEAGFESSERIIPAFAAPAALAGSASPNRSYSETLNIPEPNDPETTTLPDLSTVPRSSSIPQSAGILLDPVSHREEHPEAGGFTPHILKSLTSSPEPALDGPANQFSTALRILDEAAQRLILPAGAITAGDENPLPPPSAPNPIKEVGEAAANTVATSSFFEPLHAGLARHPDSVHSEEATTLDPGSRRSLSPSSHPPTTFHRGRADFLDAATIFAAQGRRNVAPRVSPASIRLRSVGQPILTHPVEPAGWTLATWVALPPVALTAVGLLGVGLVLSLTWTKDNLSSGLAARAAFRTEKEKPVPLDPNERIETRWWKTTAAHLSLWSVAIARSPEATTRVAEVRDALNSARRAAPLEAATRYARLRPIAGDGTVPVVIVGLSRDVASFTLMGRLLKRSGKIEPALRAYRRALELAVEADTAWLGPPTFDEDPTIRRFRLPHEEIVGGVIRDMVDSSDWRFDEWSKALPANSLIRLVAGRILREKAIPDAERAFELALADDVAIPETADLQAEHFAAQAEALALSDRREAAADRYRKAILTTNDSEIRRRWRLALAEVLAPLGESKERTDLLQAAMGDNSSEEVTMKALEAQQFAGLKRVGTRPVPLRSENRR